MTNILEVIDRFNPHYKDLKKNEPLSVGNGGFCFTADFTGLQTFYDEYSAAEDAFPLCTMAEWGWHSYPYDNGQDESNLRLTPFNTYERTVFYLSDSSGQEDLFKKIRVNAHKFNLLKIGFKKNKKKLSLDECKPLNQLLSLREGVLYSEFSIDDKIVKTETFVHQEEDILYFRISSPALKEKTLYITVEFPYGSHKKTGADFTVPDLHITKCLDAKDGNLSIKREMDGSDFDVFVKSRNLTVSVNEKQHFIDLIPNEETIDFCIKLEPIKIPVLSADEINRCKNAEEQMDSFDTAKEKCKILWEQYWSSGGFIDFSGSEDKRAVELQRRVILSQYLTAIQSRGIFPPAETGLTCNSWYGKFHLEMHFWHHAHFAFWGREEELRKALEYYLKILPASKEIALLQGYKGARWPKMCDPLGKNTPSSIAVFLIWQQPHPLMLAEIYWRITKSKKFLHEYREVIIETAEFMKSFIHKNDKEKYEIGPPYIPAQECHNPKTVLNAAFELEYFLFGFQIADEWLKRLSEPCRYGEITENLNLPPVKDGFYITHENCPETFNKFPFNTDHPSMLAMYGVLNSNRIDRKIMSSTLDKVLSAWDKSTFYGWDFPLLAMTACRLGRYSEAIDILLMDSPKNTWLLNGHNRMEGDNSLPLYLPGNGGFLLAIAMLAAGYSGKKGPLFPEGFKIKTKGIFPYI